MIFVIKCNRKAPVCRLRRSKEITSVIVYMEDSLSNTDKQHFLKVEVRRGKNHG